MIVVITTAVVAAYFSGPYSQESPAAVTPQVIYVGKMPCAYVKERTGTAIDCDWSRWKGEGQ